MTLLEQQQFFGQFHLMFRSGLSLSESLDILSKSKSGYAQESQKLSEEIARGRSLSSAFSLCFDDLTTALIRVGEETGRLELVLDRLADRVQRLATLRAKVSSSMMYPIGILLVSSLASAVIVLFFLPQLLPFLTELGVSLPWPTKLLVFLSEWRWVCLNLAAFPLSIAALMMRLKPELWRDLLRQVRETAPVVGPIHSLFSLSYAAADLGLSLSAGLGMVESLELTSGGADHRGVRDTLQGLAADLRQGATLESAVSEQANLGILLQSVLVVGEETGRAPELLMVASQALEQEGEFRLRQALVLMEPAAMVVMSLIVGGVALGSLLPLYELISAPI